MRNTVLMFCLLSGILMMLRCTREHSLENANGPAQGVLQADGTGDCLPKTVAGTYVTSTALDGNVNYIEVQLHVTKAGSYVISTDSLNGYSFKASGVFSDTGYVTIRMKGTGTPLLAETDNFTVTFGSSTCSIAITVTPTLAIFTLDGAPDSCMNYVVAGTYNVNATLTASNTVTIKVTVTKAGAYSITTAMSNGMIFTGSGTLALGAQTIVLTAAGSVPSQAGVATIPVIVGTSACSFKVNVVGAPTAATYTINCPASVVNGTYTVNSALTGSNSITLSVNVTTPGTYTITGTVNNMTFSASGSFAAAGNGQTVTLAGSGTPNTAGANSLVLTGGTTTCAVTINVNPVVGVAVFSIDCNSAVISGTYTQNTALGAGNTVALTVSVTTAGTYPAISTTATNGMTFSTPAGTFAATGNQTLTLTGSGTPNAAGTIYIPVNAGSSPCNFLLLVRPPAANSDYFPRTTNSNWSYEFDDVATDSVITKVIAQTHAALGNTYNIFMGNGGTGFDTSGFYRKSGNDYYHYADLADYLGLDNTQRVEFIFLKDNQAAGFSWTTANYTNTISAGTPITIRIKFTIVNANATTSITSSTGTISYPNTIIVEEHYEADLGTGFISLDSIIGYFRDYYSKNIGWIKDEYIDETGANAGTMEVRRWIVY